MANTVGEVIARVADLANDHNLQGMTADELYKAIDASNKEVHRALRAVNAPSCRKYTEVTVDIGIATLNSGSTPPLPTDLDAPIELWEKAAVGTVYYEKMVPTFMPPDQAQSTKLYHWAWVNKEIRLIGASQANLVRIMYFFRATDLTSIADILPVPDSLDIIAWMTAAQYFAKMGQSGQSTAMRKLAEDNLKTLVGVEGRSLTPIGGRPGANG